MCQSMQGSDAIAEGHRQGQVILDSSGKIIHGRVDKRDNEHFLFITDPPGTDQPGSQGAEGEGFSGTGHG